MPDANVSDPVYKNDSPLSAEEHMLQKQLETARAIVRDADAEVARVRRELGRARAAADDTLPQVSIQRVDWRGTVESTANGVITKRTAKTIWVRPHGPRRSPQQYRRLHGTWREYPTRSSGASTRLLGVPGEEDADA